MSALDVAIETAIVDETAVRALSLVGLTVLLYDHVLTLHLEVDSIWKAPVGFVSIVFLLNRYLVPLILIVDTYELSGVAPNSVMFCKIWTTMQSYLTIASFMSIHAIMAIRVFALHNGRICMRWFLWITGILYLLSSTIVITVAQVPVIKNLQPIHHECVGTIPPYLWAAWLPTVVFESILFIVTLVALLEQEDTRSLSTLMLILYRDGMLYFVAVTFCSTFALLVWALAPPTLSGLARYFALAVVNTASSRMVLNLKSYSASCRRAFSGDTSTTGRFSPFAGAIPLSPLSPLSPLTPGQTSERPGQPADVGSSSPASSFDVEMYAIEREYQQLGTKLR